MSEFRHGSRTRSGASGGPTAWGMPRSPSSPAFWRSPLRGPWFTSVLGLVLLGGITVLFVTGLVSYAAYNPNLSPVNDMTPDKGLLGFYLFSWPTNPSWLYRLNQGVHVTLGITLIPVLLAKLWSVVPKLFTLPPVRSLAHGLERVSLLLLVGALFEFTTGVLNVQLDYIFPVSTRCTSTGPGCSSPRSWHTPCCGCPWRCAICVISATRSNAPQQKTSWWHRSPPTVSRRGALGFVGGGSLVLFATTVAASTGRCGRRPYSCRTAAPNRAADPAASRSTRWPRRSASTCARRPGRHGGWSSRGAGARSG